MSLIRKLGWFFKLEARRYIIGILALSLVSVFNLIPPRIIGQVIDAIAGGNLTPSDLAINLTWLVGAALIMYALRYVWRLFILGTANSLAGFYGLVYLNTLPAWRRPSIPAIGPGT